MMRLSNLWKKESPFFQSLEKFSAFFPILGKKSDRGGAALIVALWVVIILSLLISAFAFDMHIEAGITSFYRKRLKAQYLARAGVEYARYMLKKSFESNSMEETDKAQEDSRQLAISLSRGVALNGFEKELGEGKFTLAIVPEPGRRNVNKLGDADWEEILDQGNVPEDQWPELIDCFTDWVDTGVPLARQLHGAESDDPFYTERGYECKNAPLDTVDELLMIKGFTPAIVYGGPSETEGGEPYTGIAQLLTTWGEGKVNINTAPREVLLTLATDEAPITEQQIDEIIDGRTGKDLEAGTKDDGWESVEEMINAVGIDRDLAEKLTVSDRRYVRITSIGEVHGVRNGIWCIYCVEENNIYPVFWREENMK